MLLATFVFGLDGEVKVKTDIPVWVLMKITEEEVERRINDKASELGLTSTQMQAMHFICRRSGQICQKDMEERFDLTHATVSGIISRLEAKGFIETRPGETDKRRRVLFATEKGNACYGDIHVCIMNCDPQLMNGFSAEEKSMVESLFMRMLGNMNAKIWDLDAPAEKE